MLYLVDDCLYSLGSYNTTDVDHSIIDLLCSAPSTFESKFQIELPLLYRYLIDAPSGKVFLYFFII